VLSQRYLTGRTDLYLASDHVIVGVDDERTGVPAYVEDSTRADPIFMTAVTMFMTAVTMFMRLTTD
jgi:hypothetical protein